MKYEKTRMNHSEDSGAQWQLVKVKRIDFNNIKDEMIYDIVYNNTNNSDIIEPTKEYKWFWVEKEENFT